MKEKIKSKYGLMKALLVVLAVVIIGVIYSCSARNKKDANDENVALESNTICADSFGTDCEANLIMTEGETTVPIICVHVCGAVATPGVYFLEDGSRIHQAVEMAGGLTDNAAEEYINLASTLVDGTQIYFPTKAEVESGILPVAQQELEASIDDGLININTAGINDLMTLPGIGESKAEAIISYRENVAAFESIEDITNVDGIKDSSFDKIKDYIKVK